MLRSAETGVMDNRHIEWPSLRGIEPIGGLVENFEVWGMNYAKHRFMLRYMELFSRR